MALRFRKLLISISHKPVPVSGNLLFFSTSSNGKTLISVSERLIHQHGFSPRSALELSSNKYLLKRPEKVFSLITLLKESGFSQPQLEKAIQISPILFSFNADVVQPKIKAFVDIGFERSEIAKMLSADPWILKSGTEQLSSNLSVLKEVLGSNDNVCHVLRLSGAGSWLLKTNLEKILVPNIELLEKCGVSSKQITRYVAKYHWCLLQTPERIQESIETVDRMGVPRLSGRYLPAIKIRSQTSLENWELKLEVLRSFGLSQNDIMHIFRNMPQVLAVSEKKLRDVFNIIVKIGKLDLSQLVSCPVIFLYSVEKRLRPRVEVYQLLESKNLLKMRLTTLCRLTNKQFLDFVSRFEDELGDEFSAIKRLNGS